MKTFISLDDFTITLNIEPDTNFKNQWKQIKKVFDWKAVKKTMLVLNWSWDNEKITIKTLKKTAKKLLKDAYNNDCEASIGGFFAKYEDGELSLLFAVDWYM